ncbi:MAG: glycoside hydrolase family 2 protein [Prevotella sp.]
MLSSGFRYVTAFLLLLLPMAITAQPRNEYPRPQFERTEWMNLNGTWNYQFDNENTGLEKHYQKATSFARQIQVPFCPESKLSGVGHTDFIEGIWYQRTVTVPRSWQGKRVLLHFGACDYRTAVYVNGNYVGEHFGGNASFSFDITSFVPSDGKCNLVVSVRDNLRSREQPSGKQSERLNSYGCMYTRTTGIWQTVWMEPVAEGGLEQCRITPSLDQRAFTFEPTFLRARNGSRLRIVVKDGDKIVSRLTAPAADGSVLTATLPKVHPWSPEDPHLYTITYTVENKSGKIIDQVSSYAGMRKVELRGKVFYLNNKPYFMRLVLDQGFYPDGIWTAPSDEALRHDIELGKEAGFNGARLHQKVFEQRYLYWADHLGYLVWGESPSWGMDWTSPVAARNMISEWSEYIQRDYNAPSVVAWSPLNEVWMPDKDNQRVRLTNDLYHLTKFLDRTRPVVATSGGYHAGLTDIYAEHCYTQEPDRFYNQLKGIADGHPYVQHPKFSAPYKGEAYIIDEYGGIGWMEHKDNGSWGYGNNPKTLEEYYKRLEGLTADILCQDSICGFCYTQLTDVEQEKNGIYTYERNRKFDMNRIHSIFTMSREDAKRIVKSFAK